MNDDDRQYYLSDEEIAERVRARKARTRYGAMFAVGGFIAGLVAAFWFRDVALTTVFMGVSSVGAGFADPSEVKALWTR